MHELSIAMSIVEVAAEQADERGLHGIRAVHMKLGPLSGVVKQYLVSAFELAREGSCLAAAELVIEDVPIVVFCPTCNADREVESIQQMACRVCGTLSGDVRSGRELEVTAMEVES